MTQSAANEAPAQVTALVWLTVAQCLASFGQITMATLSGIVGSTLAPTPQLATLPVTAGILGVAAGALPVALFRRRLGNRKAFCSALLWGALGALLATASILQSWFAGFCLGCFMMGNNMAMVAQYRFAAVDLVPDRLVSRAVSAIMVGTLAAAIIAPWLALRHREFFTVDFAGSYGTLIIVFLLTALVVALLPLGNAGDNDNNPESTEAVREILQRPAVQLAMVAAAAGYGVMSLIMTATPISMHVIDHHSAEATAAAIRGHILAMFAPSLFSGWLISRLGVLRMLWAGIALEFACIMIAVSGNEVWHYRLALILLGIGWNFLFVGGTTLLATRGSGHGARRVQGINDMVIFGTMALASLSAGSLLHVLGWVWTNLAALSLLALIMVFLLRAGRSSQPVQRI